jgi:hypothetical protein
LLVAGCPLLINPGTGPEIPAGFRLVTGELLVPLEDDFGGAPNQGMTLAALADDPASGAVLRVGVPFNPSQTSAAGGDRTRFSLLLPVDQKAALFFQTTPAAGAGDRLGDFVGRLRFAAGGGIDTSILPAGEETIDLGLVILSSVDPATNAENVATTAENPLSQIDTDGDGTPDSDDADDDADGIPDAEDDRDSQQESVGLTDAALEAALSGVAGLE